MSSFGLFSREMLRVADLHAGDVLAHSGYFRGCWRYTRPSTSTVPNSLGPHSLSPQPFEAQLWRTTEMTHWRTRPYNPPSL